MTFTERFGVFFFSFVFMYGIYGVSMVEQVIETNRVAMVKKMQTQSHTKTIRVVASIKK